MYFWSTAFALLFLVGANAQLIEEPPKKLSGLISVTALLHKDGSVELQPWYALPDGLATESTPGNYTIKILDVTGRTVRELSVSVDFVLHADRVGVFPRNTVPLIVTIPYPPRASSIAILNNGQLVVQVQIASKLLADAVKSIPDTGFAKNPAEVRNRMLDEIRTLDAELTAHSWNRARKILRSDLRKRLDEQLIDGYLVESPLQYTKPQILALDDELLQRLSR
jgi:hypothetical protein